MEEIRYELKKSFEYAFKGDQREAEFITLSAPNFKQLDKMAPIKQAFTQAAKESFSGMSKDDLDKHKEDKLEDDDDDEEALTGSQVITMLYGSTAKMERVLLQAEQLFKSGVAMVDGESKLTTPLMEKMSGDDFEGMLGEYLANFIVPSLMDGA